MKKALVLIQSAPYGEASSAEGFRVVMTLPAMGMETTAMVMDDGIFNLIKDADPTVVGWLGNLANAFAQTGEYDAKLMVHKPSMDARGIYADEIIDHDGEADESELKALMDEADVVLSF